MDFATSEWSSDLKPEDIFNLCYFSCLKPDVTEGVWISLWNQHWTYLDWSPFVTLIIHNSQKI